MRLRPLAQSSAGCIHLVVDAISPRALMLVSDRVDARLRAAVRQGVRPCTEYLRLEEALQVDLLDWSALSARHDRRSVRLSLRHALAAATRLRHYDVILSDGEHLGVPVGLACRALRLSTPHLMIGHHLTTAAKRRLFRMVRPDSGVSRILVHSSMQLHLVTTDLRVPASKLALVPYFADTSFWRPQRVEEEALIVAAGQEHRDYATLARACQGLPAQVRIAAGSLHSPSAYVTRPDVWPANVSTGFETHRTLRDLYARASVVVVPLVETDFQAGVTTLLEAMAMGKAVIVSATGAQRDVIGDAETAVAVPPGDATAMREALLRLLGCPDERARLGSAARRAVERRFTLELYVDRLAGHLRELGSGWRDVPSRGAVSH